LIFKTLSRAKDLMKTKTVDEVKQFVTDTINENPFLEVEYFSIVDEVTLNEIQNWNDAKVKVGCIAVYCGEVRLIDNIYFS